MFFLQTHQTLCTQTRFLPLLGKTVYILTEDPLPGGESQYAITIQCDNSTLEPQRTVRDITTDRSLALSLFWKICRGSVTPCTLTEVLSELLP